MINRRLLLLFTSFYLMFGVCYATESVYVFEDAVQAQRFQQVSAKLRCLVCQNQTLAESDAELALDLKQQIYQRIKAGDSESSIVHDLVTRYGDFILYQPPLEAKTAVLWVGPFLALAMGAAVLLVWFSRRQRTGNRLSSTSA